MTNQINRRAVLSLLTSAALVPALPKTVLAAAYPERAIHVAVPFSAGGAFDIVARTVMQQVGPQLGQPIVIENRPGASGNIAAAFVAKSAPDGYNVLIGANGLATNEALFDNLSFKALTDFEPISLVGYTPLILVVQPSFEAKTVKDIVDIAKAAPDADNGGIDHLDSRIMGSGEGIYDAAPDTGPPPANEAVAASGIGANQPPRRFRATRAPTGPQPCQRGRRPHEDCLILERRGESYGFLDSESDWIGNRLSLRFYAHRLSGREAA